MSHGGGSALWSDVTPAASRRLLLAALDAFAESGYHATTTRQIAEGANMSPAAVYVHYRSKAELLFEISRRGHEDVLRTVEAALADTVGTNERIRRLVEAFVAWHAANRTLARVVQYEMQALSREHFEEIRVLRRRFERIVEAEVRGGVDSAAIEVDDVDTTIIAILSLGIDVARWYRSRDLEPDELASRYADLILRSIAVEAQPA